MPIRLFVAVLIHAEQVWGVLKWVQEFAASEHPAESLESGRQRHGWAFRSFEGGRSGAAGRVAPGIAPYEMREWRRMTFLRCCLMGHEKGLTTLAAARDSRLMISGALDGTVRLWEVDLP